MRKLYFDIDGTVLILDSGRPKTALASGVLEAAIRGAGVDQLICVGNFTAVIRTLWTVDPDYDGLGAILALCGGVFADEGWFRETARLAVNPKLRAAEVDLDSDWWYMDDEAHRYFVEAGRERLFEEHIGGRILRPSPLGNGQDVLDWIGSMERRLVDRTGDP